MAFIPEVACWYIAGLVLEHTIEGDRRNVVHVNTHLIEADSPEEAYRKAVAFGRTGEQDYANTEGKRVRITFRGSPGSRRHPRRPRGWSRDVL